MNKIVLRTCRTKARRVCAKTTVNEQSDVEDFREGNIDTFPGTRIRWVARPDENVSLYTVRFFHLADGTPAWPYTEKEDGTGTAPVGYFGPLTLIPGSRVTLTTKDGDTATVKYAVTATPTGSEAIDDCDPMIIIRPRSIARDSTAFGVTSAILGAVAGTLITWFLLR